MHTGLVLSAGLGASVCHYKYSKGQKKQQHLGTIDITGEEDLLKMHLTTTVLPRTHMQDGYIAVIVDGFFCFEYSKIIMLGKFGHIPKHMKERYTIFATVGGRTEKGKVRWESRAQKGSAQ